MTTLFIDSVLKEDIPPPPFNFLTTKIYDVPYAGSRSMQLVKWYLDLTLAQQKLLHNFFENAGRQKGIENVFFRVFESRFAASIGAEALERLLSMFSDLTEKQEGHRDFERVGRDDMVSISWAMRWYVFSNRVKEWMTLALMDENLQRQVRKIAYVSSMALFILSYGWISKKTF